MKRYVIRKYVMAKSVLDAVKKERDTRIEPEDVWLDDKQPEQTESTAIGFELPPDEYYYSPVMKPKKKKLTKKGN